MKVTLRRPPPENLDYDRFWEWLRSCGRKRLFATKETARASLHGKFRAYECDFPPRPHWHLTSKRRAS